ncbi:hypothetical protein ACIBBG_25585 [Micromonospora chersina]|uniref:hypothetical protein n=1 Tax=Micromonospora chersina TaxID=47854 RepID=UPI0037B46BDF
MDRRFLVAFDNWRRYDTTQHSARPWLFGIASNPIAGHQRTEARRYRALARAEQASAADRDSLDGAADGIAVRLDAQACSTGYAPGARPARVPTASRT